VTERITAMTDSKVFSFRYSIIQEQSDLDITTCYNCERPEVAAKIHDNVGLKDRIIASWQKLAKEKPNELIELPN
jgi:hypothetical protein